MMEGLGAGFVCSDLGKTDGCLRLRQTVGLDGHVRDSEVGKMGSEHACLDLRVEVDLR